MTLIMRACAFGILAIALIWVMVTFTVARSVDRAIVRESVDKAEYWGRYMASRVPDLPGLIMTGIPTQEQRRVIREVRDVGDIFRFKLFDATGRLALVSDDVNIVGAAGLAEIADAEPMQVAQTRMPIVEVFDGTAKPDRPDLYSEAYIPLMDVRGRLIGVVEVYVDQTRTRSYFAKSFHDFSLMLVGVIAVVLAVPGIAFCVQRVFALRAHRDATFLAQFDPLTGVLNRREFSQRTETLHAEGRLTVVCFIDVDRFKSINDTHGHAAGDAFLAHVSQVLRSNCHPGDLLGRFGGDEFVIGFDGIDIETAVHRARAMLKHSAEQVEIRGVTLSGSISIGMAKLEPGDSFETALNNADAALYHAKSAGRNDFAVYGEEMGAELRLRHALEARIRAAARDCEFEIVYQPLVDGRTRSVIGHEALLRLSDVDGSAISPSVFVPLAEDLGLITEIGAWTIRTATQQAATFAADHMLAINLSSTQFRSGALVDTVREALEASGFPAAQLELEITESLLLDDSPMVALQIDSLKEMGVAIAMDDFGTGFSSLSYLWKYGFDRLKIDRSFVAALDDHSQASREIIETVVLLGERLGMNITAEGVETVEQARLLSDLGCDVLQGYYFGKPSYLCDQQEGLETSF
ncbi:bifunctional diguanylate cyclase/phosphodiesterase [Roseobacter sp.]|uniref:putative bifunctional diguanylate cyclase/phosphodiesterase n=1 Tax=Roseobacter sp. TaxID=1907202 RepID=UPI0032978475